MTNINVFSYIFESDIPVAILRVIGNEFEDCLYDTLED
jgi:hypothetical protein